MESNVIDTYFDLTVRICNSDKRATDNVGISANKFLLMLLNGLCEFS